MYFDIPQCPKDDAPTPSLNWKQISDDEYTAERGRASLRVFREGENGPWWAEGESPEFESAAWFYTPQQAQYWAEQELEGWFD